MKKTTKKTSRKPERRRRREAGGIATPALAPVPEAQMPVIDLVPALLRIRSILVPVDFSECSMNALRYAVRFAEQFGACITLVHVVESYPIDYVLGIKDAMKSSEWRFDQARAHMKRMCESIGAPGTVCAEQLALFGKPFHQICEAARERDIDLIIIATHGRAGLERLQLGSTAERVVRHAPCPVLVVREREKQFA